MRTTRRTVALSLSLLIAPAVLFAQSALTGIVREDSTKRPIPGVELVINALNRSTLTDTLGAFRFDGLATGIHFILVRKIGFRPVQLRAILAMDDTLDAVVTLEPAVVELAPVEVTVSAIPPGMEAYETRRQAGFGHFIGSKTLRQSEHRLLADIFREVPGVALRYGSGHRTVLISNRSRCPMQIYLNGIKLSDPNINLFSVSQLEAIEVYRGPAETPMQLSGREGGCGTVVLWSRRQ